jgi:hypothetical protein
LIVTLLVAMSLTIFLSPAIGLPLLFVAGFFGAIVWVRRNQSPTARMEEFREEADSGVEFTGRDQSTLTPTENR